jgi:hypothetical protein
MAPARDATERDSGQRPLTLGWKEFIDFPEWGIRRVKAKIDTGARTSALDVASYELRRSADQSLVAELRVACDRKRPGQVTTVHVPVLGMVVVSNSSGTREQRPLVETTIRLGPVSKRVKLTVTNRAGMRFAMILGRTALKGDFVVDVGQAYLLRAVKRRSRRAGGEGRPASGLDAG